MAKKNEAKIKFSVETAEMNENIKQAERTLRELRSELSLNSEQMKTNGTNVEGLEKQYCILQKESEQYEKKLNALNDELEAAARIWGQDSEEAEKLRIKINNTGTAFEKVKQKINGTEKELEDFKQDSKNASGQLGELEESAEDAGEGFTIAKGAVAAFAGEALMNLVQSAKSGAAAIYNLSDNTREYRNEMNKLSTSAVDSGYSAEYAKEKYLDMYAVLADETAANTTVSNFMAMGLSQENLNRVLNASTGIWAKYGDSIPLDGLAESVNETANVGTVTGNLADALNWAGISEDVFNEKLAKANTTSERQQLIIDTLESTYGELADAYKSNNKSIMEANRATAEYNDVLAELGREMEPITTEVKEGVTELIRAAVDLVDADTEKVVEKIGDAFEWTAENLDSIVRIAGIGAGVLATMFTVNKVAQFTTSIGTLASSFGLFKTATTAATVATEAQTVAQTGLNVAMNANPVGLLIAAGTALAGAVALVESSYRKCQEAVQKEIEQTYGLTDAEKALISSINERRQAYIDSSAIIEQNMGRIEQEYVYYGELAEELKGLVDINGEIIEGNEERAKVITDTLSDALGIEIEITDNVIQNYNEITASIEETIRAKKAEAILNANTEKYTEAICNQRDAFNELTQAKNNLQTATEDVARAEEELQLATEELDNAYKSYNTYAINDAIVAQERAKDALEKSKETQQECTTAVKNAEQTWIDYNSTIQNYAGLQAAIVSGDAEEIDLALNKMVYSFITAENGTKESLEEQVANMRTTYENMKKEVQNGAPGVTQEMLVEMSDMVKAAENELKRFEDVGYNITAGVAKGMNAYDIVKPAQILAEKAMSAMKNKLQIKSPSRKMYEIGSFFTEGFTNAIDDGGTVVAKSAAGMAETAMEPFSNMSSENFRGMLEGNVVMQETLMENHVSNTVANMDTSALPISSEELGKTFINAAKQIKLSVKISDREFTRIVHEVM